jgi:hypothetical protein
MGMRKGYRFNRSEENKLKTREIMLNKWKDPEYRRHMSEAHKGKESPLKGKHVLLNTGRTHFKPGSTPWNYKEDNLSYQAIHNWIRRMLGKPIFCEGCGSEDSIKYEWANISGKYKRELSDWTRLCKRCHNVFDDIARKSLESKIKRGFYEKSF